jgi:hypothetical protein
MEHDVVVPGDPRRYYTPWQIAAATIIGGSLAGGFFARRNYILFGAPSKATIILVVSVVVMIGAIFVGFMLPPRTSRTGGALLIVIAYRWYAESAFSAEISNRRADGWTQQSWWQVIGISVAFLAGAFLLLLLGFLIFDRDSSL